MNTRNSATFPRSVLVGGLTGEELAGRLTAAGVLLNPYAETFLTAAMSADVSEPEAVLVATRSVRELGLSEGGTLPEIFERAAVHGLDLCPPATAAYLRLATLDQATAPDRVLSTGRAPTGSLTVASPRLREDYEFPAGMYVRVIDGDLWLRGYRCDDEHVWSADDTLVFRVADRTSRNSGPKLVVP